MREENFKVFINEKILNKVKEVCEQASENNSSSFNEISSQLLYFYEFELIKYDRPLHRRFNSNNNSYKGLHPTTIAHAWSCEGKKEDGATKDLRDILCYFAFKKDWSETLIFLTIDEKEEIQRTIEKKEEYKSLKEGIPYISKENSEIKKFARNISLELITRKAGIPINEENDVIEEIYNSWYKLFCIIREEIKALPASSIKEQSDTESEIGITIIILNNILRPHLTEHQAKFRSWLEKAEQNPEYKNLTPQELQKKYPDYNTLKKSLKETNGRLIESTKNIFELIKV